MKIVKRDIDGKDSSGKVKLQAEEAEDMYHLYNIIAEGDSIKASTIRYITMSCISCHLCVLLVNSLFTEPLTFTYFSIYIHINIIYTPLLNIASPEM